FSVESWVPLLGIDAHGLPGWGGSPQPTLLSLALTDVGGDPFGPPGNGGFDPREGLEKFTTVRRDDGNSANGEDYAFNGLWLWHDTNGNGQFDPPTPTGTTGVTFTDYPMSPYLPGSFGETQPILPGIVQWGYEPFPPGGGDPWWTINLGFVNGRRRNPGDTPTGAMEATPDAIADDNVLMRFPPRMDYFVVMRADSGFQDVSGVAGDGVGLNLGGDTRCLIQPRRWNPKGALGGWDGGLLMNIQGTLLYDYRNGITINGELIEPYPDKAVAKADEKDIIADTIAFYQNSPAQDIVCDPTDFPCSYTVKREYAWWTERTHNRDTVKAVRCGAEVQDLVLTYATDNRWAKVTPAMAGQSLDSFEFYPFALDAQWNGRTAISLWTDPAFMNTDLIDVPGYEYYPPGPLSFIWDGFRAEDLVDFYGIGELRFFHRHNPFMIPDYFDSFRGAGEWISTHYAFETVPFKLEGDGLDDLLQEPRSSYWPDPPSQPALPRYSTWSGYQGGRSVLNWGNTSRCYLASEGALPNQPYNLPGSSGAEASYADDVYVFVVDNPRLGPLAGNLAGKWLVDNYGGRYQIISSSGNALTLRKGHGAYLDRERGLGQLTVPDYPYGIGVGAGNAVERGRWMIVEDTLPRGVFPRLEDWRPERLLNAPDAWAARLLKQYVGVDTLPTAMLGFNLAGTDDPAVNAYSPISLSSATVAFWGPDFTPAQLAGLDVDGSLFTSGVLLYEDTNSNGVFDGPFLTSGVTAPSFTDRIVPLAQGSLTWPQAPEVIDLDGDYLPDDLSGDGVVFDGDPLVPADVARLTAAELAAWDGLSDRAWVLTLIPRTKWDLPYRDTSTG
ncbi:MAG TPA: hypothetical protein PL005_15900, partial [Candidatus Hydrogenedentes bacterium]|nr:hypothetical protein [Candidatus Hydrogenedentota bacterium]